MATGSVTTGENGTAVITFGKEFSKTPRVFCQISGSSQDLVATCKVNSVSKAGCNLVCIKTTDSGIEPGTSGWIVYWLAVEP